MGKINVVLATDEKYVQHLVVTLTSILENTNVPNRLHFKIIDGGIQEYSKDFLIRLVKRYESALTFERIDFRKLTGVFISEHITEASYYRLFISELFDEKVKKVIYLDCDVLVRKDIIDFYNIDIGNNVLGAIRINEYDGYDQIDIPEGFYYFNAGVLLINLNEWRRFNVLGKSIHYIQNYPNKLIAHDQSVLNSLLYDKWYQISYGWNLRTQLFSMDANLAGYDNNIAFQKTKNNPSIVHFTTSSKPWHYLSNHPFKEDYFYYLDKSGLKYTKYKEKGEIFSKEIILFGTGEKSRAITKILMNYKLKVSFYVDNDNRKCDSQFLNKKVYSPSFLQEQYGDFIIIIASQYRDEISEQLNKMGFKINRDYFTSISFIYKLAETT